MLIFKRDKGTKKYDPTKYSSYQEAKRYLPREYEKLLEIDKLLENINLGNDKDELPIMEIASNDNLDWEDFLADAEAGKGYINLFSLGNPEIFPDFWWRSSKRTWVDDRFGKEINASDLKKYLINFLKKTLDNYDKEFGEYNRESHKDYLKRLYSLIQTKL